MRTLTADRWRALSPYLDQALDMSAEERGPWLAGLRAADPALATDLEHLLEEQAGLDREGFLQGSVIGAPDASLAGLRAGAYTLVSPIGRGGMGSVWLAERSDGRFKRKAAVKLLNTPVIGRAGEERFTYEGRLLAKLTHPNIAHLIDAGVTSTGQPYLVLELVDGVHIDRYCADHSLGIDARVRLFIDIVEAVAHAHANLIVHRDIKPSNVLVRRDGVVKLLDFGIGKLLVDDSSTVRPALTADGVRALTPEYAAPEQLTGGTITTATDVYALGVLLYLLLGGPNPAANTSGSAAELIKAIVETEAPRLSEVVPNGRAFRGDLDNILAKALKKRPEERYQSVAAFAEDLRRYLRREPVSARPETFFYRTLKFVHRHSQRVAAVAVGAVILAAVIGFYTVRLASERDRARLEAAKSARTTELLTLILTGADPFATRDREPTVRNILEASAERFQTELADQPELKAEILTVIGRVYQRLGMLDNAKPLLEEALSIERRAGTHESVLMAGTLNELGILMRERGDAAGAVPLLEDALAMRRRLLGSDDKDVAVTLVELGRAYVNRGMRDRAEVVFREALDIRLRVFGEIHRETSTSKSDLALLLLQRGDLAGAEPLFRQALDTSRKVLPGDHPNVGSGLNNLGLLLLDKGDYAGAEPLLREALTIRRNSFGDRHPSLTVSMSNLAVSLREQGKYDEAATLLETSIAITREAQGNTDAELGRLQYHLGRVNLARKDPRAAEPLLREALQRQERALAPGDWRISATQSVLGEALTALGRFDEAEPLLTDASAVLKDIPGRQGREAAATRERLAALRKARESSR